MNHVGTAVVPPLSRFVRQGGLILSVVFALGRPPWESKDPVELKLDQLELPEKSFANPAVEERPLRAASGPFVIRGFSPRA